jgi:uncharacterized phage-associated protein
MYDSKNIAEYFILLANNEDDGNITNLKLQKLLYYAQGLYLALYDIPLFSENIMAWQYGPVVPEIYHEYKKHSRNPLEVSSDFNPSLIDADVTSFLDEVYSVYGQYTGAVLVTLTHQESPWKDTPINGIISHELMKDFFKDKVIFN